MDNTVVLTVCSAATIVIATIGLATYYLYTVFAGEFKALSSKVSNMGTGTTNNANNRAAEEYVGSINIILDSIKSVSDALTKVTNQLNAIEKTQTENREQVALVKKALTAIIERMLKDKTTTETTTTTSESDTEDEQTDNVVLTQQTNNQSTAVASEY